MYEVFAGSVCSLTYLKQRAQREADMKTEFYHVCRGKRTPVDQERLDPEAHDPKEESVEENAAEVGPVSMYHLHRLCAQVDAAAENLSFSAEAPEPFSQRVGAAEQAGR